MFIYPNNLGSRPSLPLCRFCPSFTGPRTGFGELLFSLSTTRPSCRGCPSSLSPNPGPRWCLVSERGPESKQWTYYPLRVRNGLRKVLGVNPKPLSHPYLLETFDISRHVCTSDRHRDPGSGSTRDASPMSFTTVTFVTNSDSDRETRGSPGGVDKEESPRVLKGPWKMGPTDSGPFYSARTGPDRGGG